MTKYRMVNNGVGLWLLQYEVEQTWLVFFKTRHWEYVLKPHTSDYFQSDYIVSAYNKSCLERFVRKWPNARDYRVQKYYPEQKAIEEKERIRHEEYENNKRKVHYF